MTVVRRCEYDNCIAPAAHEIIIDGVKGDVHEGFCCCEAHFGELERHLKETSKRYHELLKELVHPAIAQRRVVVERSAKT